MVVPAARRRHCCEAEAAAAAPRGTRIEDDHDDFRPNASEKVTLNAARSKEFPDGRSATATNCSRR